MLFVGGWWDEEDILGPQLAYHTVEKADSAGRNRIVLGPWFHGDGREPAAIRSGRSGSAARRPHYFRTAIQRPWFAYYLHGKGDGRFPEAWAFATGENTWHTFDAWPPEECQPRNLYLRANGRLSFDPPPASLRAARYRRDASRPAPGTTMATSPTPRTPFPTCLARTTGAAGAPGCCRISASWTTAPTC